jgi:hypothetical protein
VLEKRLCTTGEFLLRLCIPDRLVLLSELLEALGRVAGQSLHNVAGGFLEVVGGQQLETRYEIGEVVRDAGLDETVDAALFVELDVLDLAAEDVGESRSNLGIDY